MFSTEAAELSWRSILLHLGSLSSWPLGSILARKPQKAEFLAFEKRLQILGREKGKPGWMIKSRQNEEKNPLSVVSLSSSKIM